MDSSSFSNPSPPPSTASPAAGNPRTSKKKKCASTMKLSTDPQSVAARQRRHRISDRFKILRGLVPGGSKMDTVTMLEEAIQYVKFLKTQVWLHQAVIDLVETAAAAADPASAFLPPDDDCCAADWAPRCQNTGFGGGGGLGGHVEGDVAVSEWWIEGGGFGASTSMQS